MLLLQKSDIYVSFLEWLAVLPHIILFLGHGSEFIGFLLGGKLDIVHEGLLKLPHTDLFSSIFDEHFVVVSADVHHLGYRTPMSTDTYRHKGALDKATMRITCGYRNP